MNPNERLNFLEKCEELKHQFDSFENKRNKKKEL